MHTVYSSQGYYHIRWCNVHSAGATAGSRKGKYPFGILLGSFSDGTRMFGLTGTRPVHKTFSYSLRQTLHIQVSDLNEREAVTMTALEMYGIVPELCKIVVGYCGLCMSVQQVVSVSWRQVGATSTPKLGLVSSNDQIELLSLPTPLDLEVTATLELLVTCNCDLMPMI